MHWPERAMNHEKKRRFSADRILPRIKRSEVNAGGEKKGKRKLKVIGSFLCVL